MVNNFLAHKLIKNQVFRFILSAGAGFLVDIFIFNLLYKKVFTQPTYQVFSYTILNHSLALSISFFMGVVVNFLMTKYMVFNESKLKSSKQFFRFISVAILGFMANLLLLNLFIEGFGIKPVIARIIAALSLFFASYFVHKIFSFSLSLRHASRKTNPTSN